MRPYLLPALCIGWLVGVLIGSLTSVPAQVQVVVALATAVLFAASGGEWRARLLALALLAGVFGFWRTGLGLDADRRARTAWESVIGTPRVLEGTVVAADPRGTFVRLTVGKVNRLPGSLRTTVTAAPGLAEGARVRLRGRVIRPEELRPPGTPMRTDPELVFARHHVFAAMRFPEVRLVSPGVPSHLTRVRLALRERLLRALPEPAAGFYSAFLLSFDADLPRDLRDAAAAAGILHLVAISGSHIAAIATAIFGTSTFLGLRRSAATILMLAATAVFLALTGFPESGVRSGIMVALVYAAYLLGRPAAGPRALLLAVALMTLHNPRILLGDVGFQLSALAVWGLVTIYPWLRDRTAHVPNPFKLRQLFLLTVAAEIATLPVVVYAFGRVPILGPLTNLGAGYLFALLLILGAVVLTTSILWLPLAVLLAPLASATSNVFLGLATLAVRVPHHVISVPPISTSAFVLLTVALIIGTEVWRRWENLRLAPGLRAA